VFDLRNTWITIDCPRCKYYIDVQHIDLKLEARLICFNCKLIVQIVDRESSAFRGINHAADLFSKFNRHFR
jgi:hypothetical protein